MSHIRIGEHAAKAIKEGANLLTYKRLSLAILLAAVTSTASVTSQRDVPVYASCVPNRGSDNSFHYMGWQLNVGGGNYYGGVQSNIIVKNPYVATGLSESYVQAKDPYGYHVAMGWDENSTGGLKEFYEYDQVFPPMIYRNEYQSATAETLHNYKVNWSPAYRAYQAYLDGNWILQNINFNNSAGPPHVDATSGINHIQNQLPGMSNSPEDFSQTLDYYPAGAGGQWYSFNGGVAGETSHFGYGSKDNYAQDLYVWDKCV